VQLAARRTPASAIFRLLVTARHAGGGIAGRLGIAAPTLSFHQLSFAHAGLLRGTAGTLYRIPRRFRRNQCPGRLPDRKLPCRRRLHYRVRAGCCGNLRAVRPTSSPCVRGCARRGDLTKESLMKRFHVHVAVPDLAGSIRFYSTLFGAEPAVTKPDYAKWMLDDPRVNFAISQRGTDVGLNHLGFQVDSGEELAALHGRSKWQIAASSPRPRELWHAKSDKYW
jgi:hypothetical protein